MPIFNYKKIRVLLPVKMFVVTVMVIAVGNWTRLSVASSVFGNKENSANLTAQTSPGDRDFTALKQTIHEQVNQYRASQGLPPLKLNPQISQEAKTHSVKMASGRVPFSHQGFEQRIQALKGNISYRRAAENVAYNSGYDNPAKRAVSGWIDSSSHRQNIVGNYNLTGIGIAKNQQGEYYFTQIFVLEN